MATFVSSDIIYCGRELFGKSRRVEAIQLASGGELGKIYGLIGRDANLLRVKFLPKAIIRTKLQPDKMHFTLPMGSASCQVNGLMASENSLFFNYGVPDTYILATKRDAIVGSIPLDAFLDKLQPRLGEERKRVCFPPKRVELPEWMKEKLVYRLSDLLPKVTHINEKSKYRISDEVLTEEISTLLAEVVDFASYTQQDESNSLPQSHSLVRDAEDYFSEQTTENICLDSICAAVGVSPPTLIKSFDAVVGTTPMRYFLLKRLFRARIDLLQAQTKRCAVKRTSLKNGFMQSGYFSASYKSIFNELPSTTLLRAKK